MRIDADAHLIESERTWDYLEGSDIQYRPQILVPLDGEPTGRQQWMIDGRVFDRDRNVGPEVTQAIREGDDVEGRLKHMDRLEVDVQVLFPSLFLRPLTRRAEAERALCRSYNRWVADICEPGQGRLRWAAVLPLMSMDASLEEARWARDNGACALYTRGIFENRLLTDPYYYPLYEAASDLDVPVCVHASSPSFEWYELYEQECGFGKFKLGPVSTFHTLIYEGLPQRFPRLRFGFIEVSAQWVPYALHDLAKRFRRRGMELSKDVLRESRVYVACQADDDIPYVLQYAGEDNLVIGTDYGHADTATELEALSYLEAMEGVSGPAKRKIMDDNPRALYGL